MKTRYTYTSKIHLENFLYTLFICGVACLIMIAAVVIMYLSTGNGFPDVEDILYELSSLMALPVVALILFLRMTFMSKRSFVDFSDALVQILLPKGKYMYASAVPYESIYDIKTKRLPIIGLYGIRLRSTVRGGNVVITRSFEDHVQLFETLCKNVAGANPAAKIDSRIYDYIEQHR